MEEINNIHPEWMKTATNVKCENCDSLHFKPVLRLKRISKLICGKKDDIIIPIRVFACAECGNINEDFKIDGDEKNHKSSLV